MPEYHRAITRDGLITVTLVEDGDISSASEDFMWVEETPLDLRPAQYTDTRTVHLGDIVCCGGDEFRVRYLRPCTESHPFGQIRAETGPWYAVEYAVVLGRDGRNDATRSI